MTIAKRMARVPLGLLDTGVSPKAAPPGTLSIANNVIRDKSGRWYQRGGYTAALTKMTQNTSKQGVSSDVPVALSPMESGALQLRDVVSGGLGSGHCRALALGSPNYSSSEKWVRVNANDTDSVDQLGAVGRIAERVIFSKGVDSGNATGGFVTRADMCRGSSGSNVYEMVATLDLPGARMNWAVFDATTKSQIACGDYALTGPSFSSLQCFVRSTKLCAVWSDAGSPNLHMLSWDMADGSATLTSLGTLLPMPGNNSYISVVRSVSDSSVWYIGYESTTPKMTIARMSGTSETHYLELTGYSAGLDRFITVVTPYPTPRTDYIALVWGGSGSAWVKSVNASDLTTGTELALTTAASGESLVNAALCACSYESGVETKYRVLVGIRNDSNSPVHDRTDVFEWLRNAGTKTQKSSIRGTVPLSRIFGSVAAEVAGSETIYHSMIWMKYGSHGWSSGSWTGTPTGQQKQAVLLRLVHINDGWVPCGRAAFRTLTDSGLYSGYNLATLAERVLSCNDAIAVPVIVSGDVRTMIGGGCDLITVDRAKSDKWNGIRLSNGHYLSTAMPVCFDGERIRELGLMLYPDVIYHEAVSPTGGETPPAAGTRQYVVTYEASRADGSVVRSAPSQALTVIHDGINVSRLTVPVLHATMFRTDDSSSTHDNEISTVFWRTVDAGTVFHRLGVVSGSMTISVAQYRDALSDSLLSEREAIYTDSGELENYAPSCSGAITTWNGRLWIANGDLVWYSKPPVRGVSTCFAEAMYVQFAEPITALAATQDALIAFSSRNCYALTGDGPDAGGNGTPYPLPQWVSAHGVSDQNQVTSCELGVVFSASNGSVYLMQSGGVPQCVSGPIDSTNIPLNPVNDPEQSTIRFNSLERWDYGSGIPGVWYTESSSDSLITAATICACINYNGWGYYRLSAAGNCYMYDESAYLDDSTVITSTLTTHDISPFSAPNTEGRLYSVQLDGTYITGSTSKSVTLGAYIDSDSVVSKSVAFAGSTSFPMEFRFPRQRFHWLKFALSWASDKSKPALASLSLLLGSRGKARVRVANRGT